MNQILRLDRIKHLLDKGLIKAAEVEFNEREDNSIKTFLDNICSKEKDHEKVNKSI